MIEFPLQPHAINYSACNKFRVCQLSVQIVVRCKCTVTAHSEEYVFQWFLSFLPSHPDIIDAVFIIDAVSIIMPQWSLHNIFCYHVLLHGYGSLKLPWDRIFFTSVSVPKYMFLVTTDDDFGAILKLCGCKRKEDFFFFTAMNILLPFV